MNPARPRHARRHVLHEVLRHGSGHGLRPGLRRSQCPRGRVGRGVGEALVLGLLCGLGLGLGLGGLGSPALAQSLAPAARPTARPVAPPSPVDSVPPDSGPPDSGPPYPGLEERPGDTARIRPGWHDFHRYSWDGISMCANAATMLLGRLWRHQAPDTARFTARLQDSVPPAVAQLATRCGVDTLLPAAIQQIARGDGWLVFSSAYTLAALLHRDTVADALIRGALADPHVPRLPLIGIEQVIWAQDTRSHPLSLARLVQDIALFDSLARRHAADTALQQQTFAARVWLASHQVNYWLQVGDTGHFRPAAETLLTVCAQAPPVIRAASADSCRVGTTESAVAMLHLAILQHGARSPDVAAALQHYSRVANEDPVFWMARLRFLEQPFLWPLAPYWYGASGTVLPPAPVPETPGLALLPRSVSMPPAKATLIWCPRPDGDHRAGPVGLARTLLLLQRLQAQYGPQGLQLVILEHTRGFATGLGAVPPDREAAAIRQLYQEHGGLQAVVIVDTVPYTISRDGRRTDSLSVWERRYALFGRLPPPPPLLLDRQGRLRLYGSMAWENGAEDPLLELYIQHLLKEP